MSNAGLVMAIRRKKLIRDFESAGAITPARAVALSALGSRGGFVFRRMVASGVLVATEDDRYWLDMVAADRDTRRRRGVILTVVGIIGAIVAWVLAAS